MTEGTDNNPSGTEEKSEIEKLRDEFQEQFNTIKTSYEKTAADLKESNDKLSKENEELRRALIRNTSMGTPSGEPPKQKTEEELYQEKIAALSKKSLELLKSYR